ncbi:MAG: hypothetical protein OZSIB_3677 [Candidatus Ozemobacter sibiricus]|jgi:type II secretory pathway pseudopilin PulG|uniref:Uncharacterized protein n=1 Tax=Candidatus Ozemobacter sibiricus TaxID=2268124 RepID=A0A367ZPY3_9BACT|nr:MAG: hypothetical protein OZSIB_3677 [Candidatus Ozemobacter sibiricus]
MTVVELVVAIGIMVVLLGIVFQVLPSIGRQERDLDRQLRFAQTAQEVFTLMKSDLRSLERLQAGPDRLDLTRVVGLTAAGNEQIERVSWQLGPRGVTEHRGTGEARLHSFLEAGEEATGRSFGGGFRLTGIRTEDDGSVSGEVMIDLRVDEGRRSDRPAMVASLSVAVRGRVLQTVGQAAPTSGGAP